MILHPPVPCQHIADFYRYVWSAHAQLGTALLRRGYQQWAQGQVKDPETNNLFEVDSKYNKSTSLFLGLQTTIQPSSPTEGELPS